MSRAKISASAVHDEVDRQILRRAFRTLLDDSQAVAAKIVAHDRHQRLIVELVNRREALRQDFAVRTMGAVDVVIRVEQIGLSDGRRFLADRQMRRAAMVVGDVLEMPLFLHRVEHLLERADDHHVALDPHQVGLRHGPGRQLVGHAAIVLVERNRLELQHAARAHLLGSIINALGISQYSSASLQQ